MLSACLTHNLSKHSTHSQVSINECAVVSVKVVSARKEARSAHVEISKMKMRDEGGQERTAPTPRAPNHAMRSKRACVYFYRYANTCPGFSDPPVSSLLQVLLLVFLIPRSFTVFGEWAQLSSVWVYGTCRAHDKRMNYVVSAERAYWTDV